MVLKFETLEERNFLTADIQVLETFGSNNIVVANDVAFAAAGDQGLLVIDLESAEVVERISPPETSDSIDDVAIAADLLFAIDGVRPGSLSVFSIEDPLQPTLVSGPVPVDVGPFAGVSAANGRVIVSGGTGQLSVLNFDDNGVLSEEISRIDLGVGQPDVLIANDGNTAFVSTDFAGRFDNETFGVTLIDVPNASSPISILDRAGIVGAGFSPGVDSPANFPIEAAQQGDTLFVASGRGISVFDVSNPEVLRPLTEVSLDTNPVNVDVVGDRLFVVGNSPAPTLTIIDFTDLDSPIVESIDLPSNGEPLGVAATDEHIVIADANLGVLVASNPDFDSSTENDANPPSAADIDGDGVVTFSDFLVLSTNFGRSVETGILGDIDENGLVDFSDFLLLAESFGSSAA